MKTIFGVFLINMALLLCVNPVFSAENLPKATTDYKGLWISKFGSTVLGDENAENELINYASEYGYNLLVCTNMYTIIPDDISTTTEQVMQLRNFISKAHNAGIQYISGNVGSSNTAGKVQIYNDNGTLQSNQKFDMISYECEFYNDNTNGSCSSFESYISQVAAIRSICDSTKGSVPENSLLFDVYIGGQGDTGAIITNSSQSEMHQIAVLADHISLTYYRSHPFSSGGNFFNNSLERLQWLSNTEDPTRIILLLKSRNTDSNNMYYYLANFEGTHSQAIIDPYKAWVEGSAYNTNLTPGYIESFESGNMDWLAGIQVVGFNYFDCAANIEIEKLVTNTTESISEKLALFPNPSTGIYEIKGTGPESIDHIEVYNSIGVMISNFKSAKINLSEYPSGLFIVRIYVEDMCFSRIVLKV